MYYVSKSLKPLKLKLSLHKPNKERNKLKDIVHHRNELLTVNSGQINELTFTLPYQVEQRNKLIENPVISKIREKYLIKVQYGTITEYFIITKINKVSSESDDLNVECKSLGYQLYHRQMIDYTVTSYNCLMVTEDCLKGTGWKVGYINPEFNLKYRSFDVSSQNRLDFLNEIATTFEATIVFDTVNKLIHMYKEEEVSKDKGFMLSYGQYLQSVDETIDSDEIVTRLHIRGSDNLTVNEVNPTGQSYIDDFSYFIYPFEMDEKGNITQSSYYMDDDLAKALVNYNTYVSSRKGEFANLLEAKTDKQSELTTANNELVTIKSERQIILDNIELAKSQGKSTDELLVSLQNKTTQMVNKQATIESITSAISDIDADITSLKTDLKMESHLTDEQIEELESTFVHEEEWSDDNIIDVNDLYEAGMKHLSEVNSPPVNISVGIVNFFQMITEHRNWDRLAIGDLVRIKHDILNTYVKTKVTQMVLDFENASISLTISNSKKKLDMASKLARMQYTVDKVDTEFNIKKVNWNKYSSNYNIRNDRFSEKPTSPIVKSLSHTNNDNGSVNIKVTWDYPDYSKTNKNKDNIDGFHVYLNYDTSNIPYTFGDNIATKLVGDIPYSSTTKSYSIVSVASNLYYTLAIRAYRRVDEDINSDGILFSDIVQFNTTPYRPSSSVVINGNMVGTINGIKISSGKTKPTNPTDGDKWTDTSGTYPVEKVYDGDLKEWRFYSATDEISTTVGEPNGLASLDDDGNVPSAQLGNTFKLKLGTYAGTGTLSRSISVGFKPSLVKVYTLNNADRSLYIKSTLGGYVMMQGTESTYLMGDNEEPFPAYGKLTDTGFKTGNVDTYRGNKEGVKYFYEAYFIPS